MSEYPVRVFMKHAKRGAKFIGTLAHGQASMAYEIVPKVPYGQVPPDKQGVLKYDLTLDHPELDPDLDPQELDLLIRILGPVSLGLFNQLEQENRHPRITGVRLKRRAILVATITTDVTLTVNFESGSFGHRLFARLLTGAVLQ